MAANYSRLHLCAKSLETQAAEFFHVFAHLVVTKQLSLDLFACIQSIGGGRCTWCRLTSLRKSTSRRRSRSSRMSACRHCSELQCRFCRTVSVRFPVSWLNLNKWDWSTHTWDRPAGGVARGLGGLSHKKEWTDYSKQQQQKGLIVQIFRVWLWKLIVNSIETIKNHTACNKVYTNLGVKGVLVFSTLENRPEDLWIQIEHKTFLSLTGDYNVCPSFYLYIKIHVRQWIYSIVKMKRMQSIWANSRVQRGGNTFSSRTCSTCSAHVGFSLCASAYSHGRQICGLAQLTLKSSADISACTCS